jgi:hypothetical protein
MTIVPIRYVEPVYRPPSEADSLIQVEFLEGWKHEASTDRKSNREPAFHDRVVTLDQWCG